MLNVSLSSARPETDALVIGVYEGEELAAGDFPGLGEAVAQGYRGRVGEVLVLYSGTPRRIVLTGLGRKDKADSRAMRKATAVGVRAASGKGIRSVAVEMPNRGDWDASVVQGAGDGLYRFSYKADPEREDAPSVTVVTDGRYPLAIEVAQAGEFVRNWVNMGANDKPPERLAGYMTEALSGAEVSIELLTHDKLKEMGAGGILAVGQGSDSPPAMLIATYRGAPDDSRMLALVGKGITFDSGGLSLKSGEGMMTMKTDMAGAAAVMGAVRALARSKMPVNVMGIACMAENMPGGHAQRPGDVITSLNGMRIEVLNTDAEGRLVLSDGVALAHQRKVDAIVDIATLTGANAMALGGAYAGILTDDETLKRCLESSARRTAEPVWQLPIDDAYKQMIKSPIADIKNIGGRGGGMQTGGLFIGAFAGDTPWAHVDIAGMAYSQEAKDGRAQGATAFGCALLAGVAMEFFGRV
ncbi:MAG: leucyl aminopeptidase family protein [Clostridia bacterium]